MRKACKILVRLPQSKRQLGRRMRISLFEDYLTTLSISGYFVEWVMNNQWETVCKKAVVVLLGYYPALRDRGKPWKRLVSSRDSNRTPLAWYRWEININIYPRAIWRKDGWINLTQGKVQCLDFAKSMHFVTRLVEIRNFGWRRTSHRGLRQLRARLGKLLTLWTRPLLENATVAQTRAVAPGLHKTNRIHKC
jgi:hypothetical protein